MDDDELYDEFGNYIGGDREAEQAPAGLPSLSQALVSDRDGAGHRMDLDDDAETADGAAPTNQIVLHEDKQYYSSALQVYGPGVETLVQDEDSQAISEPIVQPHVERKFALAEAELPRVNYDREFMLDTMQNPEFTRNVAVVGHLHHGKTTLLDMLVMQSHPDIVPPAKDGLRYTDAHVLERDRGISIRSAPITLMLPNSKGKSLVTTFIDTPGHPNFVDEVGCSLALVDGIVFCVDAAEGFVPETTRILRRAISQRLGITLCITKLDRLWLELRLPPSDAYIKLRHVIEEVNVAIASIDPSPTLRLSPERGNVCFASAQMGWCFSLESFAQFYADEYAGIMIDEFAARLWGDLYFDEEKRKFTKKPASSKTVRSFVHFVLEPIYKLYMHTLATEKEQLQQTLEALHIRLKPAAYKLDAKPLLRQVCAAFFGPAIGLVDLVFRNTASPRAAVQSKLGQLYMGDIDDRIARSSAQGAKDGPLMVHVTKLIPAVDALSFGCLARIYSGSLRKGQKIQVVDESHLEGDDEAVRVATVGAVYLPGGRYNVKIGQATPGMIVLIEDIEATITKSATLLDAKATIRSDTPIMRPIQHLTESVMKIAVDPYNPSELGKMLQGLRMVSKAYPLALVRVEESGEHHILGTGELYMDCVLHDLRKLYAGVEVKVSDPIVRFCETCIDTSALKCFADSANEQNRLTMIAEPLDEGLDRDIEEGLIDLAKPLKQVSHFFQQKYKWDLLASRSVWAFGPDEKSPNLLLDDTLEDEVDKSLLAQARSGIVQGFQWGTREGPLCDEPLRNTKFKILDAVLAADALQRGDGQIVPAARRVCHAAVLTASPRLLEPVFQLSCTTTAECVPAVYAVVQRRRGHITHESPIAGTPLYRLVGLVPAIDSFGLEVDLRAQTQGQAMMLQQFDSWQIVPGDPLDKDAKPKPLQSAAAQQMARDFLLKTRRRKGLNDTVSLAKYLDEDTMELIRKNELLDQSLW